ncbi:unnamed protein product, partial [Meganyctiphanes norvegica]
VHKNEIQTQHQHELEFSSLDVMPNSPNVHWISSSPTFIPASVSITPCIGYSLNNIPSHPNWAENFQIPWEKMPATLMKALHEEKRPNPPDRRQFVRIVVDEMRQHCLNPPKKECEIIVKAIVQAHSKCFADFSDESEFIGCGYHSLLKQFKARVENLNRNASFGRLRAKKTPRLDYSENQESGQPQTRKSRSPVDTYGCVNWQPIILPEGETEETLEAKRVYMTELYSREGLNGADKSLIDDLMKVTYYTQRCTINAEPAQPISEIITQWPFLSLYKYMDEHFNELTNIALHSHLNDTLVRKSPRILKYFHSLQNSKQAIQELINEITVASEDIKTTENVTFTGVILLLMAHFHEKTDSIFLLVDVMASKEDIESSVELPETPRLIVQGDSILSGAKWMLSIEGKVICQLTCTHANFVSGLAALFASYYIFHFQYEEGAAMTLEFIQRYLVGINPDTGTKCAQSTAISKKTGEIVMRRRDAVNPNVLTLINKINSI